MCKKEGGYLVKISSKEENDKIVDLIKEMGHAAEGVHFRLGLNDIKKDGDYRWISDNSVMDYNNFNQRKIPPKYFLLF